MDISRQALFGRLNPTLFKAIESATVFCSSRGNPYVELVHWLHQLLQAPDGDLRRVLRDAGATRRLSMRISHGRWRHCLPARLRSVISHFNSSPRSSGPGSMRRWRSPMTVCAALTC